MFNIRKCFLLLSLISTSIAAPQRGIGTSSGSGAGGRGSTSGATVGAVAAGAGRDQTDVVLTTPTANQPKTDSVLTVPNSGASTETTTTNTDSGTISTKSNAEIIDATAKSQGSSREALLDYPAAHNYNITAYPGTNMTASPNSFFRPLNSSYHACLATLNDVLCLPNGTYSYGRQGILGKDAGRYFSLTDVKYLIMPKGASVTLRQSANTNAVTEVDYAANVTSGDEFGKDVKSRTNIDASKPSIRSV